jgi:hypothetical protein
MKLLLLAFIDGAVAPARTPINIGVFKRALIWTVEYWVLNTSPAVVSKGLSALDMETIAAVVRVYQASGAEGLALLRERFTNWLTHEMALVPASAYTAIAAQLSEEVAARIHSSAVPGPAASSNDNPEINLHQAKLLLASMGAFDSFGYLRNAFLSRVLNIDSSRLIAVRQFRIFLRRFEVASEYERHEHRVYGVRTERLHHRRSVEEAVQKGKYLTYVLCAGLKYLSRSAVLVEELNDSEIAQPHLLAEVVGAIEHSEPGRTPSIPVSTALELIRCCVEWMEDAHAIEELCTSLVHAPFKRCQDGTPQSFAQVVNRTLASSTSPVIEKHRISKTWGVARTCKATWSVPTPLSQQQLGLSDLLDVHGAVCYVITALFSCSRLAEVLGLRDEDIEVSGGRGYIHVQQRKRGVDGVHPLKRKPVPPLVIRALHSHMSLRDAWHQYGLRQGPCDSRIFCRLTRSGVGLLDPAGLSQALDLLVEWFDLRAPDGKRWYVRSHQLRRCFALTFFHHGGRERSLPALSWFMGHRDIQKTWRYIREDLTGSEISSAEAALATYAVYSQEKTRPIEHLRVLLRRHFGCSELSMMDESEVQSYLELLHERGSFSARPVHVRTARGERFTVLLTIRRDV